MAIQHIVIDLETMSTKPTAAIVAIGAVRLNEDFTLSDDPYFYERVSLQSSMDCGLSVDAGTIEFWLAQDLAARSEIFKGGARRLAPTLEKLSCFIRKGDGHAHVWGYGPEFDNVVLTSAYKAVGISPLPWHYRNNRSLRELRHLYPNVDVTREGTFHNALDDAKWQAELLQAIMKVRAATVPASAYSAVKELADARGDFLTQLENAGALDESPCHPGYEGNTVTCCKRRIQHAEERVSVETAFTDMM